MRKMICILLIPLVAIGMLCFTLQEKSDRQIGFSLEILANESREEIVCWKQDDENHYFFLPSHADLSRTRVQLLTNQKIYVDGILLTDGMSCDAFQLDVPYEGSYTVWGRTYNTQITFVQSANVATMHIDTASGNMDYIHAKKGNKESGDLRLYTTDGRLNHIGAIETIKGRGNSTWEVFDKKPYSLELTTSADLLAMGAAQSWILLANGYDPSNLRNKLVFDFADEVGLSYCPDSEWVDLYLNGEYAGLYLLCERNEVHQERVDIPPEGTCLVSMEREDRLVLQNYPHVITNAAQALRIHYPDDGSKETVQIVYELFQSIENALLDDGGIDGKTGKHWLDLIDLESWVKKYLIEEVFANHDGCFMSQYFYYAGNSSGKVYAGPVWDYDLSWGNIVNWQFIVPEALYVNRLNARDGNSTPWFHHLYKKNEFNNRLIESYEKDFLPRLRELLNNLNDYAETIARAASMNQIRWRIEQDVWSDVKHMNEYLSKRIVFLSGVWLEGKQYHYVQANHNTGTLYAHYMIAPGEGLAILPRLENNQYQDFIGWYYVDTNEPVDTNAPVYKDIDVYAKWSDSDSKKTAQVFKLMPLVVIALLGVCLLTAEVQRSRKVYNKP